MTARLLQVAANQKDRVIRKQRVDSIEHSGRNQQFLKCLVLQPSLASLKSFSRTRLLKGFCPEFVSLDRLSQFA